MRLLLIPTLLVCLLLAGAAQADHHETPSGNATAPTQAAPTKADEQDGWVALFNGKDLTGWKASENPDTFSVQDGVIVAKGPRSHLFYTGEVGGGEFKDFELQCEILTKPKANSGVYFHTVYQEKGWPDKGYEVQVNQSHGDRIKSGSLYAVKNIMDKSPVKDDQWYKLHVIVKGKSVVVKINDEVVNEYTEPEDHQPPADRPGRKFSSGTIALQGHDPGSEVHYRSVKIKLGDD